MIIGAFDLENLPEGFIMKGVNTCDFSRRVDLGFGAM
jgi:hypothetical protein